MATWTLDKSNHMIPAEGKEDKQKKPLAENKPLKVGDTAKVVWPKCHLAFGKIGQVEEINKDHLEFQFLLKIENKKYWFGRAELNKF